MRRAPFITFQKSRSETADHQKNAVNPLDEYMSKESTTETQHENPKPLPLSFAIGGSRSKERMTQRVENNDDDDDDDEDPLDAFMRDLENTTSLNSSSSVAALSSSSSVGRSGGGGGGVRIESEDHVMDTMLSRHAKKRKLDAKRQDGGSSLEQSESSLFDDVDDIDDLIAATKSGKVFKRDVESLPAVDHDSMNYPEFKRELYHEAHEIASMPIDDVAAVRNTFEISVLGSDAPNPVERFDQCGLDQRMMRAIQEQKFDSPTPIQRQAIPAALRGRDLVALAKTGSGKTLAYVLPMITHVLAQQELPYGEGPIALIVAPTRELVQQIYGEVKKYSRGRGLRTLPIFGGQNKTDQFRVLRKGCDILVAAPGRLVDLIKMKACKLTNVSMLILDEADRMFDLGFERQCRALVSQIRPDRQTLLFSATLDTKVERLVRDILTNPLRIAIGAIGQANRDVTQRVVVLDNNEKKWPWLINNIGHLVERGTVMIFVAQRIGTDELANNLNAIGVPAASIHGEKTQEEREDVISAFKQQVVPVLVATDVAARGLDIPHVKTVVNFDVAKDIDAHVHRIGRTGRAGDQEGVAYTLVIKKETRFASQLIQNLEQANQHVPSELMSLALSNPRFSRHRKRQVLGAPNLNHVNNAANKRGSVGSLKSSFVRGAVIGGSQDNSETKKADNADSDVNSLRPTVEIIQPKNPKPKQAQKLPPQDTHIPNPGSGIQSNLAPLQPSYHTQSTLPQVSTDHQQPIMQFVPPHGHHQITSPSIQQQMIYHQYQQFLQQRKQRRDHEQNK